MRMRMLMRGMGVMGMLTTIRGNDGGGGEEGGHQRGGGGDGSCGHGGSTWRHAISRPRKINGGGSLELITLSTFIGQHIRHGGCADGLMIDGGDGANRGRVSGGKVGWRGKGGRVCLGCRAI